MERGLRELINSEVAVLGSPPPGTHLHRTAVISGRFEHGYDLCLRETGHIGRYGVARNYCMDAGGVGSGLVPRRRSVVSSTVVS